MKKIILSISALMVFQLLSFSQVTEVDFRKFPYLIYPGNPDQMTVLWQTGVYDMDDNDVECTLYWDDGDNSSGSVTINDNDAENDFQYIYTIGGLLPQTKYDYTVTINNLTSPGNNDELSSYFVTAPSSEINEITFYAYGDTRNGANTNNTVCSKIVENILTDAIME
jgi:hypothetical protein